MASLNRSLEALISGASVPELKEALRVFESRCPRSKEVSQRLSGGIDIEERGSRTGLARVVQGVCDRFEECESIVEELLGVNADEFLSRSNILDGKYEEERELEAEAVRKKRGKTGFLSPPTQQKTKKIKIQHTSPTPRDKTTAPFRSSPDQGTVGNSFVQASSSSSAAPSSAPRRKRTIEEIFEADRQRRELELLQELQHLEEEAEIRANCAQCGKCFLTDNNPNSSCVFHPGVRRRYHPDGSSPSCRWFCCGRERWDEGCMEAKHIDDRIPGESERIRAIRKSARREASAVVYRSCKNCYKDVVVEYASDASKRDQILGREEISERGETSEREETSERGETSEREEISEREENSEGEEAEYASGISDNDEAALTRSFDRFLCDCCTEEAAAKYLQCYTCGEDFKALPSHDAYTAEKPVCEDCSWRGMWREHASCSKCWKDFELSRLPYWYESDDDVLLCADCKAIEFEDEESDSIEGL